MVEFYVLELGEAVKSVGVRQVSGDLSAMASPWRLIQCSDLLPGQQYSSVSWCRKQQVICPVSYLVFDVL